MKFQHVLKRLDLKKMNYISFNLILKTSQVPEIETLFNGANLNNDIGLINWSDWLKFFLNEIDLLTK